MILSKVSLLICVLLWVYCDGFRPVRLFKANNFLQTSISRISRNSKCFAHKGDSVLVYDNQRVVPLDYVVHAQYGVGRFIRIQNVTHRLDRSPPLVAPAVVVQFKMGELILFKELARKYLYLHTTAATEAAPKMDTLLSFDRWHAKLNKAQRNSEE